MALSLIVGAVVAGGTYLYAKKRKATSGTAGVAAAATGAASAGATWLALAAVAAAWPVLLLGGAVAGAYYLGKKGNQKALPPSSQG
jgi:hypothetical protein